MWEQLTARILVIDADQLIREQLERLFTQIGYDVVLLVSAQKAPERLAVGDIDLVVTDIEFPGLNGIELVKQIQEGCPDVPVIVITGHRNIETAVKILKQGVSDYIIKPLDAAAVQQSIRGVLGEAQVFTEIRHLRRTFKDSDNFAGILSKAPEMHRVFEIIRMVSAMDVTVLVEGETGTGKELVAKAIHYRSARREGPLVTINCGGIPETLLEAELFGYERGAFTGADKPRAGKIEQAQGGILFLDEIESMSFAMQAKLLRVLDEKKVQKLGGSRMIQVDMRVIAATNVPLRDLMVRGQVRSDFYYRINVVSINLIPLRQRREDIPLLVEDFLHQHPFAVQKGVTGISQRAMSQLVQYSWPGNIRELQNVLEKAIVLSKSRVIEDVDLPVEVLNAQGNEEVISPTLPFFQWIQEHERKYLIQKLETSGGKIGLTAESCGIGLRTLSRKMHTYGLDKRNFCRKALTPTSSRKINSMD